MRVLSSYELPIEDCTDARTDTELSAKSAEWTACLLK